MFKIGQKLTKENYTDAANWCNAHPEERATIFMNDSGEFYIGHIPDPTEEEIAAQKREQRDALLAETDKYMLADFPISEEEREQYRAYRAYLRTLPQQDNFISAPVLKFEEWRNENNQSPVK